MGAAAARLRDTVVADALNMLYISHLLPIFNTLFSPAYLPLLHISSLAFIRLLPSLGTLVPCRRLTASRLHCLPAPFDAVSHLHVFNRCLDVLPKRASLNAVCLYNNHISAHAPHVLYTTRGTYPHLPPA